jgi:glycosyltransferase involved in cell wall biosynthesis
MISVMILTRNEEQDLPGCLESVSWCDDVHVYDSHSTDCTVEIARQAGAIVTRRHFDDWSSHQNWGISNLPFRHPWVFYLDADERVTPKLAESIRANAREHGGHVAFRVRRRDFWGERWLRHVVASSYFLRLFRPEKMHYERLVNPVSIPDGAVGETTGYLDHYPFRKGATHWLSRHNSYSSLEAQQVEQNRGEQRLFSLRAACFAADFNRRRFHQKELFYRLPARPLLKFLALYFGKCGFLDGGAGFSYATLQAFYEYMIVLKTRELERKPVLPFPLRSAIEISRPTDLGDLHADSGSNY